MSKTSCQGQLALPQNYTTSPNEYTDILMPLCRPNEWMVLSHIIRRTEGWHKQSEAISVSQFATATGLSATAIRTALKQLQEKGIIAGLRQVAPNGGTLPTRYHIMFPVARQGDAPQDTQEAPTPAAPTPMHTAQPHDKENFKEIPEKEMQPAPEPIEPIIAVLTSIGVERGQARVVAQQVRDKGKGRVWAQAWVTEAQARSEIVNKAGFVVKMLREGYEPHSKTPPESGGASWWQSYKGRYA